MSEPLKGKVLVIDDDGGVSSLIKDILESVFSGLGVEEAATVGLGLAKLEASRPDLILFDVMLPDMNGFDAVARLRGAPATAGLRIIMMSTMNDRSYRVRAEELGATFLQKPFTPSELEDAVRKALPAR